MGLTRPRYSSIYDTDYKQSVRVATTGDVGNLLATGTQIDAVDGVNLNQFDRILVKNQNDGKQNGIYEVLVVGAGSNGTWRRSLDADGTANDKVSAGMMTVVSEGDANQNTTWRLSTPDPITVGVTSLSFINPYLASNLVGGYNKNVQYNNNGVLDGSNAFTFDPATQTVFISNAVVANTLISSGNLYANQFVYSDGTVLGTYSNVQLTTYLAGDISTGNISAGNITAANIALNYLTSGKISSGVRIPTSANVIYVAKNGNDSNDGTINAPFLTIKAALAVAAQNTSVQVAPGTYVENNPVTIPKNVALMGDDLRTVIIYPQTPSSDLFYVQGGCYIWGITIRNYLANGFAYDPSTPTQNVFVSPYIQNITSSTTTGTAVKIDGSLTSSISTKAMIVGFFTIINQGGIGVHITNAGYSQLVNIYTIACDIGIFVESGAFCTLNGSDCSIGNYGLKAVGTGPLLASGNTAGYSRAGIFNITNLTAPPHVNQVMVIENDTNYYNIDTIIPINAQTYQVVIQETYAANLAPGANISFYQRSAIVASAHTFEYVGAGTNPANALPQYGGIPIEANEVIMSNGGKVTYTSTDHKGNFKIGPNLTINQGTGTISGDSFNRSMFALMTPYILALEAALS